MCQHRVEPTWLDSDSLKGRNDSVLYTISIHVVSHIYNFERRTQWEGSVCIVTSDECWKSTISLTFALFAWLRRHSWFEFARVSTKEITLVQPSRDHFSSTKVEDTTSSHSTTVVYSSDTNMADTLLLQRIKM
jgi:hypothetical protein